MILSHLILNIRIYLVMQYLLFQLFLVIFWLKQLTNQHEHQECPYVRQTDLALRKAS